MTFEEYEKSYYEIANKAIELYGGESEHFKNNLKKLKLNADESVSYEIIYSVALHESIKYQQDFIFLNLGKRLFRDKD
ncbi:MAG: hypothetical protein Q4F01_05995 [Staphylococcus rostri]|uniref:hypothetical protein n=1 Tax=Staphylococcus rostri TaxID=522262 RepID=UPI0026E04133|nr:hypothetical protein [Staphylococcus rostri]MDO5375726.1 hypothetical protein [Staphylococcus rostri]